ncbi:MAG: cold shock domain-containing protein [Pseudomonadales bacterium]|nr:cold shock domain-containing protein [Halieaceae bacterium]MCP5190790.1 cold shock domain-containing protein [Pseudomonadales bacterium]MCP5205095.1 cold shock domain-containing protein [Pseudomonadales bacterium]
MNLVVKLVISLVIAAIAAAGSIALQVSGTGLYIAFAIATLATTLLVSSRGASAEGVTAAAGRSANPAPDRGAAATAGREQGRVKWFNVSKGFGFITKDDGEEIFVHFRSIRGGGRRGLRDGQRVSFIVAQSDKGPQAEDVEGID